jgi:hypothetical protein
MAPQMSDNRSFVLHLNELDPEEMIKIGSLDMPESRAGVWPLVTRGGCFGPGRTVTYYDYYAKSADP